MQQRLYWPAKIRSNRINQHWDYPLSGRLIYLE